MYKNNFSPDLDEKEIKFLLLFLPFPGDWVNVHELKYHFG